MKARSRVFIKQDRRPYLVFAFSPTFSDFVPWTTPRSRLLFSSIRYLLKGPTNPLSTGPLALDQGPYFSV
ncbi:hypothetical protein D9613_004631 [Agrocybe pediades]|uniref:Uncharacterized protein n=1 Tax=Agrocybe pediades TaxID=84607 RepID=A0A8H4QYJ1_9AGAR|nr:hypothetical protein D9613_004631 [Agrocybe pediades]